MDGKQPPQPPHIQPVLCLVNTGKIMPVSLNAVMMRTAQMTNHSAMLVVPVS